MEKFGDPEFVTHATAARLYTLVAMRAAGAEVVPLKFAPYGEALREYVDDLRRMVASKARAVESDSARPIPVVLEACPGWSPIDQGVRGPGDRPRRGDRRPGRRDGVPQAQLRRRSTTP